jgi:hypothetical protein
MLIRIDMVSLYRYCDCTLQTNLANLRSNLEGLALGAKPDVYEQARKIERRVAWMANYLNDKPTRAARPQQWELETILSTMKLAGEFMQATVATEFTENLNKANGTMADSAKSRAPRSLIARQIGSGC